MYYKAIKHALKDCQLELQLAQISNNGWTEFLFVDPVKYCRCIFLRMLEKYCRRDDARENMDELREHKEIKK